MCTTAPVPASLSDEDLLAEVTRAATGERHATATLIAVLAAATGQRKRAVEELVRRLAPLPDPPSSVRRLPARAHPASRASATPPAAPVSAALATERPTSSPPLGPTDARVVGFDASLWGGTSTEGVALGPAGAASAFVATPSALAPAACAAPRI